MDYCLGIDVGGTTVKLGLFQEDGLLLDKWEIKTRKENAGESILPDVAAAIKEKMAEHHIAKINVKGIGLGVPAPINKQGFVRSSANLGWKNKDVKKEMEELTGIETRTGNDANIAALGEMWKGGGAGYKNLIMVTLGTGVGGGVIIDGEILVGTHGAGAEIGHITVEYDEENCCGCGRKGCLEQYASATGIARLARNRLAACEEETVLNKEDVTTKDVFDALKSGDKVAEEIVERFGKYLGYALANIAVVADPEVIVIGGGVSKAGEILLDFIKKPYLEKAFFANSQVEFALAKLENDAGIYGAAKLVL